MAEELHAEQPPSGPVSGDAHGDAVAAEVVGLVVVCFGRDGDGVVSGGGGFEVAQASAGGGVVLLHYARLLDRDKRGVWVYYRARTETLASLGLLIGFPPL